MNTLINVIRRAVAASILLLLGSALPVQAAEIHVLATGALSAAFREIVPAYEKLSGNTVVVSWGPSYGTSPDDLPVRLRNHEPMDACFMIGAALDDQVRNGYLVPQSRIDVARSRVGLAVRPGLPKPDIGTVDAVRAALLQAGSVAFSEGASGKFVVETLFPRLGIADAMKAKTVQIKGKELVGTALARGEADIGIQQISELRAIDGIQFVGPLPDALQKVSVIAGALGRNAAEPAAAVAFIHYLQSPEAKRMLEKAGLDPAGNAAHE